MNKFRISLPERVWRLSELIQLTKYVNSGFAAPAPNLAKRTVLGRNALSDATWVETGTYYGDTTEFLSGIARLVHSIEPQDEIFVSAAKRLKKKEKCDFTPRNERGSLTKNPVNARRKCVFLA